MLTIWMVLLVFLAASFRATVVQAWLSRSKTIFHSSWALNRKRRSPLISCLSQQDDEDTFQASSGYNLGLGKNLPFGSEEKNETDSDPPEAKANSPQNIEQATQNWVAPVPVQKLDSPKRSRTLTYETSRVKTPAQPNEDAFDKVSAVPPHTTPSQELVPKSRSVRKMVARDQKSQMLRAAMWDEGHYQSRNDDDSGSGSQSKILAEDGKAYTSDYTQIRADAPPTPLAFYQDIDLSIPESVYSQDGSIDLVWDLLRWEAYQEAQREPLLVSFMYSTILNHQTLESSLAFLLANRLQSPAMMISTQLQSLVVESLANCEVFRRSLRADIMAVRDRDPACKRLPDVFLYFKGFHALQSHRVAHRMWNSGRRVLAQYLQSQVSQVFQIDIHPNATLGSGIMLDHGTGIVVGETATIGHNCSILHHVTLGGSGKRGVIRHPQVGNGVLLGAGSTVLGPISIGDGSQVGAGTLVILALPAHCVAVGVPARIIGSFLDVTEQPSIGMNQMMDDSKKIVTFESDGI